MSWNGKQNPNEWLENDDNLAATLRGDWQPPGTTVFRTFSTGQGETFRPAAQMSDQELLDNHRRAMDDAWRRSPEGQAYEQAMLAQFREQRSEQPAAQAPGQAAPEQAPAQDSAMRKGRASPSGQYDPNSPGSARGAAQGGGLSPLLVAEARKSGIDPTALTPEEFAALAAGGVKGLLAFRGQTWNEEAAKRPTNPFMLG